MSNADQPTKVDKAERFSRFCKFCALHNTLAFAIADQKWLQVSKRKILHEYETACSNILELLFIRYQKGGRNLQGVAYKTLWNVNEPAVEAFMVAMQKHKRTEKLTASIILDELKAAGFEPGQRVKKRDGDGNVIQTKILFGEALVVEKARLSDLNRVRREYFSRRGRG